MDDFISSRSWYHVLIDGLVTFLSSRINVLAYLSEGLICSLPCSMGTHSKFSIHQVGGEHPLAFLKPIDKVWVRPKIALSHQLDAAIIWDWWKLFISSNAS